MSIAETPSPEPSEICPICKNTAGFIDHRGRTKVGCAKCGSLVRTRAVYLALTHLGVIDRMASGEALRIAQFAPERALYVSLGTRHSKVRYRCFDIEPERYTFAAERIEQADLCDARAAPYGGTYDVILHNHVMEHVPCDVAQVIGRLHDCLAPGGVHMFTLPTRRGGYDEDLSPDMSAAERKRRFAQEDHMRIFGEDDVEAMVAGWMGQEDVVMRLPSFLSREDAVRYGVINLYETDEAGIINGNTLFCVRKPAERPGLLRRAKALLGR